MTVRWHVDDLMISHKDPTVVTSLLDDLTNEFGELRITRGKKHDYLGMQFDFSETGKVKISMEGYEKQIQDDFSEVLEGYVETPASDHLFQVRPENERKLIPETRAREFHKKVAQLLFLCCRSRRDIRTAVSFLTTRVKQPDEDDWNKLVRVLRYLRRNPGLPLTLEASDMTVVEWWIDASFAVHQDYKGHTGGTMSLGKGSIIDVCAKQKANARSSTEAELYGVDQSMPKMIWSMHFLEGQGFSTKTILHQDNMSTMRLEMNGKRSSGQRTRHLHIKFFFVTDQIEKGWLTVQHCPTEDMIGDFFTKPVQGELFRRLRAKVMNCPVNLPPTTT
ncbi:hypothetical protein THAOC_00781 [Thalassiosira oceanica]|uniref:Reverse transcriptase Ty1/copia-type domain-containing protein n=1 Tax=Thalassiosira oceanica TaxID=159749 RepID=K0TNR3_THAOC|nr:hypothetical protein THAOC_00781 [Thalassiosira oceanica]|eukprot:EJK77391.1 hypothetical protein THAOC_00781 [Thalassiosira oceanica]